MLIQSTKEGRECLFRCAQAHAHVEFEIELFDINEPRRYPEVRLYQPDYGVRSAHSKAILFRSFNNRIPKVTFAGAFLHWACPDEYDLTFNPMDDVWRYDSDEVE